MSETTNLKLFKHDEPLNENTNQFNVKKALNENWDKVDDFAKQVNDKVVEKVEGKGLSTEDFTTEFKTKLENLNNYDDTEVKQDIANIKQEQTEQNTNITKNTADIEGLDLNKASKEELQEATLALRAELLATKKDSQASSLEGQAEGESLYLQDGSNARFREFKVEGNSKQATRSGKNKLNLSKITKTTKAGVTCKYNAGDNSVTFNGTCTENNTSFTISGGSIEAVQNKTTLSAYYVSGSFTIANEGFTQARLHNAGYSRGVAMALKELSSNKIVSKTYTYKNDTLSNWYVRFDEGDVLDNFTFKLMLTDEVDTEYEDFGAMPSLEFSSEIEALKDNANVTVCNKNLLDFSKWNNISASHGTVEQVENEIKLTATANDCYTNTFAYKFSETLNKEKIEWYGSVAKPNTEYTFSCKVNNTFISKRLAMFFADKDGNNISHVMASTSVLTATTPANCRYITVRIGIVNVGDSLTFTDLQLEEGKATEVVKHEEQTFTIDVQQEMLEEDYFDLENEEEVHTWGKVEVTGDETDLNGIGWFKSSTSSVNAYGIKNERIGLPVLTENTSKCTHAKYTDNVTATNTTKYTSGNENLYLCFPLNTVETLEDFKTLMQELYNAGTPLTIYYKLAETIRLPFTDTQKAVAKQIRETLHSYKDGTHVYSTDSISPTFNVKYTKDAEAYIQAEIEKIAKGVINNV